MKLKNLFHELKTTEKLIWLQNFLTAQTLLENWIFPPLYNRLMFLGLASAGVSEPSHSSSDPLVPGRQDELESSEHKVTPRLPRPPGKYAVWQYNFSSSWCSPCYCRQLSRV